MAWRWCMCLVIFIFKAVLRMDYLMVKATQNHLTKLSPIKNMKAISNKEWLMVMGNFRTPMNSSVSILKVNGRIRKLLEENFVL